MVSARSKKSLLVGGGKEEGLRDITLKVNYINYPVPGELFEVGMLLCGRYVIKEVCLQGRVYYVEDLETGKCFYELYDKVQDRLVVTEGTGLFKRSRFFMGVYNATIANHYGKIFHFGVDLNPVYQRDLVWSLEQKQSFIAACFDEQKNLGMLTYHHNGYGSNSAMYTVIDGKQRLTALMEFRMNYFGVGGYFYRELSEFDKSCFDDRSLPYQEIRGLGVRQQAEVFLSINDTGVPVSREHLYRLEDDLAGGVYDV